MTFWGRRGSSNDLGCSGGSRICKRGAKVKRRRRKYRGTEGAEGVEVWGGGFPSPPSTLGEGSGERAVPPPQKFFLTLDLKMSTSSAFWALFFAVQLFIVQARNTAFGLTKLAAAACMQCSAQRQQKAANTSMLESRSLLQTATSVFPRPIVCSRLSNNKLINILAKKIARPPTGGHAPRPSPGLDPPLLGWPCVVSVSHRRQARHLAVCSLLLTVNR